MTFVSIEHLARYSDINLRNIRKVQITFDTWLLSMLRCFDA